KFADRVIIFCVSDVEGLVVDNILGCIKHRPRSPDDVADVHNRTPRRTVALDINTSSCVRGSYEIVKHEIETQPGRRAISRGVSKIGRTKVLIGQLCYVTLDEYLRL